MTDKAGRIGEIIEVMKNTWDLPADCNEGELFTYAEVLYDRIAGRRQQGSSSTPIFPKCRSTTSN